MPKPGHTGRGAGGRRRCADAVAGASGVDAVATGPVRRGPPAAGAGDAGGCAGELRADRPCPWSPPPRPRTGRRRRHHGVRHRHGRRPGRHPVLRGPLGRLPVGPPLRRRLRLHRSGGRPRHDPRRAPHAPGAHPGRRPVRGRHRPAGPAETGPAPDRQSPAGEPLPVRRGGGPHRRRPLRGRPHPVRGSGCSSATSGARACSRWRRPRPCSARSARRRTTSPICPRWRTGWRPAWTAGRHCWAGGEVGERFVTAVFAEIPAEEPLVRVVNYGHPPPSASGTDRRGNWTAAVRLRRSTSACWSGEPYHVDTYSLPARRPAPAVHGRHHGDARRGRRLLPPAPAPPCPVLAAAPGSCWSGSIMI